MLAVLLATATSDRWTTLLLIFVAEFVSWAGVPAVGAAAMGAGGALASQGTLSLWSVVVLGTLGGWLGGMVGWRIGYRVARAGLDEEAPEGRFAERREKALTAGEKVATKWGRLMVFFVPSWVSGALGMPFAVFVRWNFLAALVWTLGAALSAYGIGSAASGKSLSHILVPLLIGGAAIGGIVWAYVVWRRHRGVDLRETSALSPGREAP